MEVNLLRKIPITMAILVGASAFAAMDTDSRITQLEQQMKQVRTENAMGTYGAKTASARPDVDGNGWFLTGDVFYWKAAVGGTEYAYSDQDPIAALPISGRVKDMDFDWDWGFRVGIGYNFLHDGWDVSAQYTWFNSSGSDSSSAGLNSSLVPLKGLARIVSTPANPLHLFLFCRSAKSQYNFDFQSVDLDLGRNYFVSGKLSFRPYFGLKAAWIDQQQITRYTGGEPDAFNNIGPGINTIHVKDDCDFKGLGPRTGLDSKWHLGHGFSIFGNFATALVWGFYDVSHKEKYSPVADNHVKLSADMNRFSPTVQFQLGLAYDAYFLNDTNHITIGLGFDAQYWWRQNQMLKIDDSTPAKYERYSEDVSMQGVTLDIKWDF